MNKNFLGMILLLMSAGVVLGIPNTVTVVNNSNYSIAVRYAFYTEKGSFKTKSEERIVAPGGKTAFSYVADLQGASFGGINSWDKTQYALTDYITAAVAQFPDFTNITITIGTKIAQWVVSVAGD